MSQVVEQTMCKSFTHARNVFSYLGSADNMNVAGTIAGLVNPEYLVSPSISCTVSSCEYWAEGARCVAEAIEVNGLHSDECQDTNCKTFSRRANA